MKLYEKYIHLKYICLSPIYFFITLCFEIISNAQESCKNSLKNSHRHFIKIHTLLTFCHICYFALSSLSCMLTHSFSVMYVHTCNVFFSKLLVSGLKNHDS